MKRTGICFIILLGSSFLSSFLVFHAPNLRLSFSCWKQKQGHHKAIIIRRGMRSAILVCLLMACRISDLLGHRRQQLLQGFLFFSRHFIYLLQPLLSFASPTTVTGCPSVKIRFQKFLYSVLCFLAIFSPLVNATIVMLMFRY